MYPTRRFPELLILSALTLMTACSSIEYNSTNSPKMVVSVEHTPFYHNGPAQGNGPDFSLMKGDDVEVLRKELGYSFVRISDGQNGYVANEALAPAPPVPAVPRPTPTPKVSSSVPATNSPSKLGFRY